MTFSILAFDPISKAFGGASATGNICVGGWVLRADPRYGISATQGAEVSTLWGEDVIKIMGQGFNAKEAVLKTIENDHKKNFRQLSAIDTKGNSNSFDGKSNEKFIGSYSEKNLVISGNTLKNQEVIPAMLDEFKLQQKEFPQKLIRALYKGFESGGDIRGIQSAALLIVSLKYPPINLRVDLSPNPIFELENLYKKTLEKKYKNWLKLLPVRSIDRSHK